MPSSQRQEIHILLGTQMIAKGLDFPNVTMVGVVNADVGLHRADFRAGERTFQLLAQVAGRTGRGSACGRQSLRAEPSAPSTRALPWPPPTIISAMPKPSWPRACSTSIRPTAAAWPAWSSAPRIRRPRDNTRTVWLPPSDRPCHGKCVRGPIPMRDRDSASL